ncbi:SRPBCC domain-containing protein [Sporolactobacillus kofuensis]|uniref:SRPBCC domain-containing protein n=1 Tax=Sporolactobacillus kofuensis TaxID=269672 RepID=A0ABW1WI20_9BACL|nr:SRPBCC domain-containing protein [Sporolactobacillus kofuensis]MCO7177190.1 SRPBCC domain-containing protein [Sporolactobacillus kofuensis]
MNNLTKMKIDKPANEVFEAFVDPSKIGNFWFSSSSQRWEQGKTITLKYREYNAQLDIYLMKVMKNKEIVFKWGPREDNYIVTIRLIEMGQATIVTIIEDGFKDTDEQIIQQLVDDKEGWVFMLTCLKAYLESGVTNLRTGLVKD